eukprot:GFUD01006993.1.p1 GENE.GFUD01006993.1~~GFUD01006993.1.p1  ORF type:complete len:345 (+),score=106.00 GFUD01006993.1:54-1088(+)
MEEKKKRSLSSCCSVCSGPSASHIHYGAVSCYSCRAFFRRGIGKPYCCVEGTGDCPIDWTNRRSCQWCRFDKCLRVGMNPELVDASLRKKSLNKKTAIYDEPVLIDNLKPLENTGVISNLLQDINPNQNAQAMFLTHPSYTIGDLGDEKVYLLQDGLLSEQNFLSENFYSPPSSSLLSETGSSPTSSLTCSDYSEDFYSVDTAVSDEYPDTVTNSSETGLDIYMDDFGNVPENIYKVSGQDEDNFFHHQASVIVKNSFANPSYHQLSLLDEKQQEFSLRPDYTKLNNSVFTVSEKMNSEANVTRDDTAVTSDNEGDEDKEMSGFDIETLVEECFRQMGKASGGF